MTSHSLKTTTALVASLSLIIPHTALTQETSGSAGIGTFCETAADPQSCEALVEQAVQDGTVVLDEKGKIGANISLSDGQLVIGDAPVEVMPAPETAQEEVSATDDTTAAVSEEAVDQTIAETESAPATAEANTDGTATQNSAETEAAAAPEGDAAQQGDANVETTEETRKDSAVAQDEEPAPGPNDAKADGDTDNTRAQAAPQENDTPAEESSSAQTSEADPAPAAVGEAGAETDNAQADPAAQPETGEAAQPDEVAQSDTAVSTQAANATAEVEATAAEEDAEVEIETVAESDVRSSSEDFDTKVGSNTQAAPQEGGLSNLEKLLVGAAGAIVVGALLKNGDKVVSNSGDRIVVERDDGGLQVLKDDDLLLRRPGSEVRTQTFNDGSTRTTVIRPNGDQVVTIRSATGQVLQRTRIMADGREVVLFDDTREAAPVVVSELPTQAPRAEQSDVDDLRQALAAQKSDSEFRRFSLQQIRQIRAVRELAPEIELQAVNFETGSAAIRATEAQELSELGNTIRDLIAENPYEVFLIEGHTDAVGNAGYNLALSDRRAESVALALTEYFDVPSENLIVQGYGEANLKVRTAAAERQNRRAAVRRITQLLQTARLQ